MTNNENTAAIESLRNFALSHGEMQFAHLCSSALNGEEWAAERLAAARFRMDGSLGKLPILNAWALKVICSTDTTRPDGGTSRSLSEV